jgi:PAS domain S-box-containing protein
LLRTALSGRRSRFEFTYGCHGPHQLRWFRASGSWINVGERQLLLVRHATMSPLQEGRDAIARLPLAATVKFQRLAMLDAVGHVGTIEGQCGEAPVRTTADLLRDFRVPDPVAVRVRTCLESGSALLQGFALVSSLGAAVHADLRVDPLRGADGRMLACMVLQNELVEVRGDEAAPGGEHSSRPAHFAIGAQCMFESVLDEPEPRIVWVDGDFAAIFGCEPEVMLRAGMRSFYPDEEWSRAEQRVAAMRRGERVQGVFRILRADAQQRWVEIMAEPILDSNGTPTRAVGVFRDVTDDICAADHLRSGAHVERIGTWQRDLPTGRIRWSRETYDLFEQDPANFEPSLDWLRQTFGRAAAQWLYPGEDSDSRFDAPLEFDTPIHLRSGLLRWLRIRGAVQRDASGPIRVMGTVEDVTERRRLQQLMIESIESERRRIGLDLHDSLGQQLTALSAQIGTMDQRLKSGAAPTVEDFRELLEIVGETHAGVRSIAAGLAPSSDRPGMLVAGLENLAARLSGTVSVRADCRDDAARAAAERLPVSSATHLLRIAQEAASNALRHGRPRNVLITLALAPDRRQLVLSIADDGCGFAIDSGPGGFGLQNMRYRASLLAARLEVRSGVGVLVKCVLQVP